MASYHIDLSKSIEELENDYWITAEFQTILVDKCHRLRQIPIEELTIEQTRLLITQNIGLEFLIPKAMELLNDNILAGGNYYPGDLLNSVLTVKTSYWENHTSSKTQVIEFLKEKRQGIEDKNASNRFAQILKTIDSFLNN